MQLSSSRILATQMNGCWFESDLGHTDLFQVVEAGGTLEDRGAAERIQNGLPMVPPARRTNLNCGTLIRDMVLEVSRKMFAVSMPPKLNWRPSQIWKPTAWKLSLRNRAEMKLSMFVRA